MYQPSISNITTRYSLLIWFRVAAAPGTATATSFSTFNFVWFVTFRPTVVRVYIGRFEFSFWTARLFLWLLAIFFLSLNTLFFFFTALFLFHTLQFLFLLCQRASAIQSLETKIWLIWQVPPSYRTQYDPVLLCLKCMASYNSFRSINFPPPQWLGVPTKQAPFNLNVPGFAQTVIAWTEFTTMMS